MALPHDSHDVASDSNPTWSADGRKIAFESNRRGNPRRYEDSDVYVMGADGSGIRQLTFSNAFDGDPAWSVSNRIAFESERTGSSDVWAIDSDGSDETQLTKNSAFDGDPVVSRRLEDRFHEQQDNGDREIYVMNADGSGQTRLTAAPASTRTPRGRRTASGLRSTRCATATSRSTS